MSQTLVACRPTVVLTLMDVVYVYVIVLLAIPFNLFIIRNKIMVFNDTYKNYAKEGMFL